jgi:hypothetical protein
MWKKKEDKKEEKEESLLKELCGAEWEERRTEELEKAGREARKKERSEN